MKKRIKPGYRALFYGPPGTGKTLTATLLGKHTGKDVFRIDLSRVVSKYIGETEKNLSRLFDKAENKDWILFFDEADALFGKRTDIRDAHDKYANQEVAYLLQRIESYDGLVILASNQRANIDDAFVRRLQAIIHFPMPRPEERYEIWRKTFPPQISIADDVDWRHIAARHELTGAGILNVTHFCAIDVLAKQTPPPGPEGARSGDPARVRQGRQGAIGGVPRLGPEDDKLPFEGMGQRDREVIALAAPAEFVAHVARAAASLGVPRPKPAQAAGIAKRVSPRAPCGTASSPTCSNKNVEIRVIQVHVKLETTALYTRVAVTRSATSPAGRSGWASSSRANQRPPDRGRMRRAWREANVGNRGCGPLSAIETCRTAALGGQVERCEDRTHARASPTTA